MGTCRECKNYEDCNANKKIKIEVVLGEPIAKPCNYVEQICRRYTPKERGADKPKITCLNCKHFMFSDCYGECNKLLKIVNPSDTCEFAEPKERGN